MANGSDSATRGPRKEWFGLSSPIGVIGGFTALSEVAMVVAAVQTDGAIQLIMSLFAVLFPVGIAALFFFVLWHRPEVLYPPREYGTTTAADFASAMTMRQRDVARSSEELIAAVEARLRESLTSQVNPILEALSAGSSDAAASLQWTQVEEVVERSLDSAAAMTVEQVRESLFFTLSFDDLDDLGKVSTTLAYDPEEPASRFLFQSVVWWLSIYDRRFSPEEHLRRYGVDWAWRDKVSGTIFDGLTGRVFDSYGRPLESPTIWQAGIRPGMALERATLMRNVPGSERREQAPTVAEDNKPSA